MQLETKKHLEDMRRAAELILQFTAGRHLEDYRCDALVRSGVERQFGIIGEALIRLTRADSEVAGTIGNHRRIIAFRNVLIHGYDAIEDDVVWGIVQQQLPQLLEQVRALLQGEE